MEPGCATLASSSSLAREAPRSLVDLRGERNVEKDSVQVHPRSRIEHEGRVNTSDDLLGPLLVPGDGPLVANRDDTGELGGSAPLLVGYRGDLTVDLHRVYDEGGNVAAPQLA